MARQPLLAAAAVALLAVAAAVAPTAAAGEQQQPDGGTGGRMLLTLSGRGKALSWIRWVELDCPPRGAAAQRSGSGAPAVHPDPARACADLDGAGGELRRMPRGDQPCTREYDPVTASATGSWHGRPVAWHETFGNTCEMHSRTGAVFAF
ncbi:SSI family serine proteinase inhibitor [Streptomyces aidingensis]|uniref:Subtilisin inhibitor-like n=1 Tax=Streptomyces aidingensis TaxID=910347 RepID=A0A1I1GN06_9ACTN|nr:SSI family serine proteinase inhibitor [Streptomyces aidingensis]SFC12856.1 Subtilisin inhibitor-like [Streptomyces aidingensis]